MRNVVVWGLTALMFCIRGLCRLRKLAFSEGYGGTKFFNAHAHEADSNGATN
jgi:hypothetical protein